MSHLLTYAIAAALVAGAIVLGAKSLLLHDNSTSPRPPFSFSRVQLYWWVVVIAFCFIDHLAQFLSGQLDPPEGPLPKLNATCLILLGIGVGTTGLAQVMDGQQRSNANLQGTPLTQDTPSVGFFTDILSDESGLSVHRLQALVFNLIYGVSFVIHFLSSAVFDEYGKFEFAVLGLSDAAYLGLKALENNPQTRVNPGLDGPATDVLLDVEATPPGPGTVG